MNSRPARRVPASRSLAMLIAAVAGGATATAQVAAAQTAPAPAVSAAAPADTASYVLGPGDVLEISIAGDGQPASRVPVQVDGTFQMALIGSVHAGGLTVVQLRDVISAALKKGGYYTNPAVNITIVSYASRYVVVLGDVGAPGMVPIERAYHVSDVLAKVGGVKTQGARSIKLHRATGEDVTLDLVQISSGGGDQDPLVYPGDKVFVPTAQTFYILGQVNHPGNYPVDDGLTLRKALAIGGGITILGSKHSVKVVRNGNEIKNFGLDDKIEIGDVIEVGERFF